LERKLKNTDKEESPMGLKEGDRVRISSIGKDYRVRWVGDRMVVLETEDRSSQFLTTLDNIRSYSSRQSGKIKTKPPVG
jgi:hypothetical protein